MEECYKKMLDRLPEHPSRHRNENMEGVLATKDLSLFTRAEVALLRPNWAEHMVAQGQVRRVSHLTKAVATL